jgi:hypothetical protein
MMRRAPWPRLVALLALALPLAACDRQAGSHAGALLRPDDGKVVAQGAAH